MLKSSLYYLLASCLQVTALYLFIFGSKHFDKSIYLGLFFGIAGSLVYIFALRNRFRFKNRR